jgi:hypothetical protein
MTKATRKPTAVLGWFPTTAATEQSILDMASARQVALRTRLRHHYWLTDCQPLSAQTVALQRRKLTMIDPQDTMSDEQVAELLSTHYGFHSLGNDTWSIPDLEGSRDIAVGSLMETSARAAAAGRASAASRAAKKGPIETLSGTPKPGGSPAAADDADF